MGVCSDVIAIRVFVAVWVLVVILSVLYNMD